MTKGTKYVGALIVAFAVLCVFVAPSTTLPDTVKAQTVAALTVMLAVFLFVSPALVASRFPCQPAIHPSVSDLLIKERLLRI